MATFFRWRIANKIIPFLRESSDNVKLSSPSFVSTCVKVNRHSRKNPQLCLSWNRILKIAPEIENSISLPKLIRQLKNQGLPTAEGFLDIDLHESPTGIAFTVDKHVFSRIILSDIYANEENMKRSSSLFQDVQRQKVVVQYSLPSVGKIFRMNDFRNTIHSDFILNIHQLVGNDTEKIYKMADWSLQSALLLVAYRQFGNEEELLNNPIRHLGQVLKAANKLIENDLVFRKKVFSSWENLKLGKPSVTSDYVYLRDLCVQQNQSFYQVLGIDCKDLHFKASDFLQINEIYENLLAKNLISINQFGEITIDSSIQNESGKQFQYQATNSTVYHLCSSIHSAIHAKEACNFDVMYYVSSSSKREFFSLLFFFIEKLGFEWSKQLCHIELSKVPDYETSRRKNTPAEDMLQEAKSMMVKNMTNNFYLEDDDSLEKAAESLSYSSIRVFNMKHRRNKSFPFEWKEVLHFGKDSGTAFQLCHAGLKGLQEETEFIFDSEIDTSPLLEYDAQQLILHLSRFDEIVYKSYVTLEPSFIYEYLSSLWYYTDKASNCLKLDIKSDRLIVIKARLLLLSATLKIFQKCLKLLGLKPYVNEYSQPNVF